MNNIDELNIYRGKEIQITKNITVIQPTISQIADFGESKYFNSVYTLTGVGADFKWQLWDNYGIDYTTIDDYDLFLKLTSQALSSKKNIYNELMNNKEKYSEILDKLSEEDLQEMNVNPLSLILKDIDLSDFSPYESSKNHQIILYNKETDVTIDRMIFNQIVEVVRKIHGLKRNNEVPGNEVTKMNLIEDARDDARLAAIKPYKSILVPLISALSVQTGQCGDERIWNMKINMFFDSLKRINKIQDAQMLLQSAYSGFGSLKGVDKERLNWAGNI